MYPFSEGLKLEIGLESRISGNSCGLFLCSWFCLVLLLVVVAGGGGVFDNCHPGIVDNVAVVDVFILARSHCQDGRLERVLSRTSDMDVLRQRVSAQMLAAAEDGRLDVAMQKKDQATLNRQTYSNGFSYFFIGTWTQFFVLNLVSSGEFVF